MATRGASEPSAACSETGLSNCEPTSRRAIACPSWRKTAQAKLESSSLEMSG